MSALEDFALGFLQTYKGDMDKKAAEESERRRRKEEYNERVKLANEQAKIQRRERAAERAEIEKGRVVSEGLDEEGNIVSLLGSGDRRVRKAESWELSSREAAAKEAELKERGLLAQVAQREAAARASDARAALANRTDPNRGDADKPFRLGEEDAALVLGINPTLDDRGRKIYSPEQLAKIRELQGEQVDAATYNEMLRLAREKAARMRTAAGNALNSNLL